jgi:acetylornithine/N-succinyldiaminopimelate aminotransferase
MLTARQLFMQHLAPTSDAPILLEIERAEGIYLYDTSGKKYTDLISGIGVSNLGHRHPEVIKAVKDQLDKYMHLMVYGEYIQAPQVKLAALLANSLPPGLDSVYFTNSGSEAIEGSLKLAKRLSGHTEIIAMKNAYHGSTHGSLSLMDNEFFTRAFRPLLPGVRFITFNDETELDMITSSTACVVIETIQGEAGFITPAAGYLEKLAKKCRETGTLLIADEIQCGFGRTGRLFAFEDYGFIPDILVLAKGMGGGMPLGAFIASREMMNAFTNNPVLGHITTFGGHPVSCAASLATLEVLLKGDLIREVKEKSELFRELLVHPSIKRISGKGLMLALEFETEAFNKGVIKRCIEAGVITDWFLFRDNCLRICPPLIITKEEIHHVCKIILDSVKNF